MRGILGWAISLLLMASPTMVMAKGAAGDTPAAAKADASATTTAEAPSDASGATKADSSSLEVEIDELRDLLQSQSKQLQNQSEQLNEQQKKMEMMEDQLRATNAARANLSAAPAPAAVASASAPSAVVLASNPDPAAASQPITTSQPVSKVSAAAQAGAPESPPAIPARQRFHHADRVHGFHRSFPQ